jgi:hypothetical protein
VQEVDPCFAWNCQVMAGVGVVGDIRRLYRDMHTYLAGTLSHSRKKPPHNAFLRSFACMYMAYALLSRQCPAHEAFLRSCAGVYMAAACMLC